MSRNTHRLGLVCVAAAVSIGPCAGLLAAGAARSFRRGDQVLPWLYLAAIPCAWLLLAGAAVALGSPLLG